MSVSQCSPNGLQVAKVELDCFKHVRVKWNPERLVWMHICRTQSLTNLHNHNGFDTWRILLGDAFSKRLLGRRPHSLDMKRGMRRQIAPNCSVTVPCSRRETADTTLCKLFPVFRRGCSSRYTHLRLSSTSFVHRDGLSAHCQTFTRAGVHKSTVPVAGNRVLWKMHCWSRLLARPLLGVL